MAQITTINPIKRRIVINDDGNSTIEANVQEIYSEWKEWVTQGDNAKYPPAFDIVGGNQISETDTVGFYYFLINNWRIRPAEKSHRLVLVGNLFTTPAGFSPVVATLGNYNVVTEYDVSNIVSIANSDQELLARIARDSALAVALIAGK